MATAIVSIACHLAGVGSISVALLWVAVLAFAPLAAIDIGRACHPLALLHRAGDPGRSAPAFGFCADTCVLGARIVTRSGVTRTAAAILLVCGAFVWLVIVVALVRTRAGRSVRQARGEWLLAVVATEGLAILAAQLDAVGFGHGLGGVAVATWALGGILYVAIGVAITSRLVRRPLHPGELTPDWWVLMGAAAIFAVAAVAVQHDGGTLARSAGLIAWGVASAWIPVLVAAEVWQARRVGLPRFDPARWTTVFPLGMYCAAGQAVGHAVDARWITTIGRHWLVVALAAWMAVALGEIHHAFTQPSRG